MEWTTAIVLLVGLRWPGIVGPATLLVVARWICGPLAADLFNIEKGLLPKLPFSRRSLSSLLTPVGKQSCEFPSARIFQREVKICLSAEVRELCYGLQKVFVGVNRVSQRKALVPVGLRKY